MVYELIKAKLPQRFFPKSENPPVVESNPILSAEIPLQTSVGFDIIYHKYPCVTGNPLSCEWTQKTLAENPTAKTCKNCGFPAILSPKTEIRGYKGKYRLDNYLGDRGMGRLYQGTQLIDQQPAIIKEYLLPPLSFNSEETRERKQAFERLAGLSLADGRIQDIRLNLPWDALADPVTERCYLITTGNIDTYPTLRTYMATPDKFISERNVYRVLDQVLQTLQFLHSQKFTLPTGQIQQGIAHGNINLDSLLILQDTEEFFIYVSDLALWERLFYLPSNKILVPSVAQDLKDLGYVAFYLLVGKQDNYQFIDPKIEHHWPSVTPELKAFLFRLLELDTPFSNAEEARQSLLNIAQVSSQKVLVIAEKPEDEKNKLYRPSILILSILGLLILGGLIWWIFQKFQNQENVAEEPAISCLKNVTGVPTGKFNYTGEQDSTWSFIRKQKNLILSSTSLAECLNTEDKDQFLDKNLEEYLEKQSQNKLHFTFQPKDSVKEAIADVKSRKLDFAVLNQTEQFSPELRYDKFAYDGLVIFVAFSYSKRDKGLPQALNGQISIQQIQDLYTGKVENWRQLKGANLPDLRVKLYIPEDKEAIRIFEERVLQDANYIDAFRKLPRPQKSSVLSPYSTLIMLQNILRDFEQKPSIGSIGFAKLSQVFGQCSVYPLAIVDNNKTAVQTLIQDNGKVIDPNTDLCDDKGSYQPNIEVFKTGNYPLSYPLVVLYAGDNSRPPIGEKFGEMLKTTEVQQLLEKTGLVPLHKSSTNRK